ncbi:hypothetical protein CSB09_03380 [Candidatus Gracilibacteria bacterium]|nr:MAG: hypothetical protein CSB09_03380 [Candidatus Gracilibacteria bacterium]
MGTTEATGTTGNWIPYQVRDDRKKEPDETRKPQEQNQTCHSCAGRNPFGEKKELWEIQKKKILKQVLRGQGKEIAALRFTALAMTGTAGTWIPGQARDDRNRGNEKSPGSFHSPSPLYKGGFKRKLSFLQAKNPFGERSPLIH